MKQNVYLDMKPIEEAKTILFKKFETSEMPVQRIKTPDALGRVLAAPAFAAVSSPNFHAAAMDGIAVDAAITFGASEDAPKTLTPGTDAFWINTGHVMPENANSVIMIEYLNIIDDHTVEIESPVFPWQNVRKMGEDIVATELLFPSGHIIDAYALGALVSGGVFEVDVYKKPAVLIIPTGSELKAWETVSGAGLAPGEVIESNGIVLGSLCKSYGAEPAYSPMLEDDLETIKNRVKEASENNLFDMILLIGGSSAGSMDYSKPVISDLGKVFVHGVTMMPGKPVIFGEINGKPIFGIPGYPVSAIVAFEQFAGPLAAKMQHFTVPERQRVTVTPTRKIASKLGQEEFIRVKIGAVDHRLVASQLPRGSGSITTLTEADGIIRIPGNKEGISREDPVEAELIKPLASIKNTVVITGSHDNTLDILADQIRRETGRFSISSSHVGSMGGLMAIKNAACHMAGSHLLDPEDGTYNISYIKKYLPGETVWLVNLVYRDQGLIVPKGNPKNIKGLEDLQRHDISFVNRQPGAGTRILLDYKINLLGIDNGQITGYTSEEYTHMSVAAAVLSGRADAGLGIYAAARALGLDFIPSVTEKYDLVIPHRFFNTDKIGVLMDTIQTDAFKSRVESLGGYSTQDTGEAIRLP